MASSTSKLLRLWLASMLGAGLAGVWSAVPAAAPQNQETPEVKSEETTPTFTVRAQRNGVLVPVIVRDANGNAVRGLTKDDFRLFDNGKPQSVTAFSVGNNQPAQPEAVGPCRRTRPVRGARGSRAGAGAARALCGLLF
jgi:hypothetical protein